MTHQLLGVDRYRIHNVKIEKPLYLVLEIV